MGICGTKSKEQKSKNKNNSGEKYHEKETNDNNHIDLEDYVIPEDQEQKIEFLCSQKLNKHIRMRSLDSNFFYKIIVESNITSHNELERAIIYVREKIKQKNESILKNFDTKGSTCIQLINEYQTKIKDADFKGILAMCQQEKNNDNTIPPLLENVFTLSVKCYQIVLTILLSPDQESIEKWWVINKDNNNITEELFNEIKDLNKQLTLKNEQHHQIISMLVSRRTTLQKPLVIDQIAQLNQQPVNQASNINQQDQVLQEIAADYLTDLYGSVQGLTTNQNNNNNKEDQNKVQEPVKNEQNNKEEELKKQQSLTELKEYVNKYLQNLSKIVINELEFAENIQDLEESDHIASACINYSVGLDIKKKSLYLSRKD